MPIATAILAILQYAPQAYSEVVALYNAVKGDMSATDQATIDAALLAAQDSDALATMQADAALDDAAKR